MNNDDIIRLTKEAGWVKPNHVCNPWSVSVDELERFASLVAAAEREACAKVCEEQLIYFTPIPCPDKISGCLVDHHGPVQRKKTATECAEAIRARGEV